MSYIENRIVFASDLGVPNLFEYVDHWQLYVGQENLSRFLTIYETLKEIKDVPGDVAELGSWQGANLIGIANSLRYLNPNVPKKVYSFDSFEGLTNPAIEDLFDEKLRGKYRGDLNKLKAVISLYDFDDQVCLEQGFIENSVPKFVHDHPDSNFSLLYYDADFYEPAEIMFRYLAPRLNIGGVILLDEYGTPEWPGETKSVDKFLSRHTNFVSKKIESARQPTLKITRIS